MKRFIYIFIMLLWMISYATAQESLPCRGTATTVLNVRSGPGISYARVGQLSRGQEVNVIQKSSNNWVQIEFGSQRGYAYSKYLKFSPLPQKANSPPAKSSSGSSSWSFWSIVWNIITWGLGIYLGLVVLYWLLKILIISYFIVSASLTFTFRLLSLPFFFLNALQRYLAKPWFIFFKKNRFSNATNENLRFIFYFLQFPFYVLLFPLRIVNAVFFNLLVHCSFEMFNYVMEVILPSEDKEGHDDFIRWILFLPYRIIKYVVWHGSLTIIESAIWTVIEVFLPTLTLFHGTSNSVADGFCETLVKTLMQYAPIALEKPDDYEARAEIMYACTFGCNGLLALGTGGSPWPMHGIEHALSGYYDITHGEGLAIITPHWMRHVLNERTQERIVKFGVNVFGLAADQAPSEIAEQTIARTAQFFKSLGMPMTLREVGIDDSRLEEMAHHIAVNEGLDAPGTFAPLNEQDILSILKAAL
jgi:hypothetical protein